MCILYVSVAKDGKLIVGFQKKKCSDSIECELFSFGLSFSYSLCCVSFDCWCDFIWWAASVFFFFLFLVSMCIENWPNWTVQIWSVWMVPWSGQWERCQLWESSSRQWILFFFLNNSCILLIVLSLYDLVMLCFLDFIKIILLPFIMLSVSVNQLEKALPSCYSFNQNQTINGYPPSNQFLVTDITWDRNRPKHGKMNYNQCFGVIKIRPKTPLFKVDNYGISDDRFKPKYRQNAQNVGSRCNQNQKMIHILVQMHINLSYNNHRFIFRMCFSSPFEYVICLVGVGVCVCNVLTWTNRLLKKERHELKAETTKMTYSCIR